METTHYVYVIKENVVSALKKFFKRVDLKLSVLNTHTHTRVCKLWGTGNISTKSLYEGEIR